MSGNDASCKVYINDIDDWIDIDDITGQEKEDHQKSQAEQERLEEERQGSKARSRVEAIGDIHLLAGQVLSPFDLSVLPEEWVWQVYQAERRLREFSTTLELENAYSRQLHNLGQAYSVRRYARFEGIPYQSAVAAVLSTGIRALFAKYLMNERLKLNTEEIGRINFIINDMYDDRAPIAYLMTSKIQAIINLASKTPLSREATRQILSLFRLHFSVIESQFGGLTGITSLEKKYLKERTLRMNGSTALTYNGSFKKNWPLRHLVPLTFFYPASLRQAFSRGIAHQFSEDLPLTRTMIVNEIALANCSIMLIAKHRVPMGTKNPFVLKRSRMERS
jgi:hypothetical protein